MSLPDDLIVQARTLIFQERNRPKQASLRRAISTAYYALFHLLVQEASARIASGEDTKGLRSLVSRTLNHTDMKRASVAFSGGWGSLPQELRAIATNPIPIDLRTVARVFTELQQARHEADYNIDRRFTRSEAIQLIQSVEIAFVSWQRIRRLPVARMYLLSLLLWNRWSR